MTQSDQSTIDERVPAGWELREIWIPPGHMIAFDRELLERTGWAPLCIARKPIGGDD